MSPIVRSTMASAGKVMNFSVGSRTSKLMVLYMWLSTAIIIVTIYKAPEQLVNAGIAIGALGAGASSFKAANAFEARSSKNSAGDVTS